MYTPTFQEFESTMVKVETFSIEISIIVSKYIPDLRHLSCRLLVFWIKQKMVKVTMKLIFCLWREGTTEKEVEFLVL